MDDLRTFPHSITSRLEPDCEDFDQDGMAELARKQPELFAVLMAAKLGGSGIEATTVEAKSHMQPFVRKGLLHSTTEYREIVTEQVTTTRTLKLLKEDGPT